MARLHRELIARGEPARWLVMTHGIYGAGSNWRGIARKLTERRPDWGVVLVDLRNHGKSEAGEPPHTIAACAADLRAVVDDVGATALAGHSFGGKVVLATQKLVPLAQTWVLDASPSARPDAMADPDNTVVRVLAVMERMQQRWTKREDFVAAVMADGHSQPLAQWLAMNLVPDGANSGFALRLDLGALREMLVDYYQTDLWDSLQRAGDVHFVIAARSRAVSAADRARLATVPVTVHSVDADHWLHIEAPANVIELFAVHLP